MPQFMGMAAFYCYVLLAEGSTSWDWVVRECHPDWYTHHCWVDKNMMDDVS